MLRESSGLNAPAKKHSLPHQRRLYFVRSVGMEGGTMTTLQAICLGAMLAWTPSLVVLACLLREAPLDELSCEPSSQYHDGEEKNRHKQSRWPDHIRLSDLEPLFTCQACGIKGADLRPDFNWNKKAATGSKINLQREHQA